MARQKSFMQNPLCRRATLRIAGAPKLRVLKVSRTCHCENHRLETLLGAKERPKRVPKFGLPRKLKFAVKVRVVKTVLLANGHFCWGDTRHFRHFRRFPGSEEQNPLFWWAECNIRIFANFRQNHLFSAGGHNDRFPKRPFRQP